jgi:hypothetical protein
VVDLLPSKLEALGQSPTPFKKRRGARGRVEALQISNFRQIGSPES